MNVKKKNIWMFALGQLRMWASITARRGRVVTIEYQIRWLSGIRWNGTIKNTISFINIGIFMYLSNDSYLPTRFEPKHVSPTLLKDLLVLRSFHSILMCLFSDWFWIFWINRHKNDLKRKNNPKINTDTEKGESNAKKVL